MKEIREIISTPIKYECDVCVAGGGIAGIAAAIAAARRGARVILLERGFLLGGLATAGIVTIYLPLCDGMGNQVTFGLAEELFKLSIEHGSEDRYPKAWLENGSDEERKATRFEVQFNPQLFAISAERLLTSIGVKILYGAPVCSASVEDGRISALVIEGKGGREAISVRSVVDATGDADLARITGEKSATFKQGNLLAAWYYCYTGTGYRLNTHGFCDIPDEEREAGAEIEKLVNRRFLGLDTEELSDVAITSHAAIEKDVLKHKSEHRDYIPVTMPTIPQIRMTRRVDGITTIDTSDDRRYFADSVGTFSNWKKRGPIYELPFSSLHGKNVKNLLFAGRCISATEAMWDVTRVIPVCAVSGEAAGAAAAICDDLAALDIKALQDSLRDGGVKIHIEDISVK